MKNKIQTLILLEALALLPSLALASTCVQVEVLDQECKSSSLKLDLDACEDQLIAIQKVTCTGNQMSVQLRGVEMDYKLKLASAKSAEGKEVWTLISQNEIGHRTSEKTMQPTEHERAPETEVSINVPALKTPEPEAKVASAFLFSAYFDGNYAYNFNHPRPVSNPSIPQNNLRAYDLHANQFDLNLAEFTLKHVRKETSFILDLDFGQFADINAQSPNLSSTGGPTLGVPNEVTKYIGQAIFTYTPAWANGWMIEFGKMPSHLGLELMKPKDNWNYSRSALFTFGMPLWHEGMHLGYTPVSNQLSLGVYLYNGWNTVNDANFEPTYGFQAKWTPSEKLTVIYNYLGGPEQALNDKNWKQVHEVNVSFAITPTVSIASDGMYGFETGAIDGGTAQWFGVQLGAKWQTSPRYYLSPRIEWYHDPQGYTLGGQSQVLSTFTLTQSVLLSEGFELRLEGRLDHSSRDDRFSTASTTSANQPTVLLGILYTL